ncbi:hypothetical protein PTI98_005921 [Pleurotus ostreatus]|nr:hypothetical protein PTI98_005921 [Pleurotus ostreatus]
MTSDQWTKLHSRASPTALKMEREHQFPLWDRVLYGQTSETLALTIRFYYAFLIDAFMHLAGCSQSSLPSKW